ncbi:helix-turn-helix transcriptional regulator [Microbacterium sp.]|uniref:helix-turn-helix transcriptional regulator n=1 Tax=Microbacterium sp. TaxID=51671 RepID=UPI003F71664F
MQARDDSLLHAIEVINAGGSLDIVGENGSGRAALLDAIGGYFTARGTNVLRVEGWHAFSSTPLAALGWLSVSMSSLLTAYNDMVSLVGDRASLILVDSWELVDPMSWGVLTRVRRHTGTPIATTRLIGSGTTNGFINNGAEATFQLRLAPLRVKELERTLSAAHGHEFDPGTMSDIYAATAGNEGLARALYEAALRAGRLRLEGNTVHSHGDLWTPAMSSIVETVLRPLPTELRDDLATLAFLGSAPIAQATGAIGREAIEALADLGFIEIFSAGSVALVAVRQPLIVSYFRNETSNIRRMLVTEDLHDVRTAGILSVVPHNDDQAELFVALVHEYERQRLAEARAAWDKQHTRDTAAALLAVLGRASNTGAEISALIRSSRSLPGTPEGIVAWDLWYASYHALVQGDPAGAARILDESAREHPEAAGALQLRRALVETMLVRAVDPGELPDEDSLPADQAWLLPMHRAYIALAGGDVDTALALALPLKDQGIEDSLLDLVVVIALTADGQYARARQLAAAGITAASEAFDPSDLHRYVYMAALSSFIAGRHGEAEDIIGTVSQLVAPVDEGLAHLGIQAIATSIAARRGGVIAEAPTDAIVGVQGAFPGMQREWIDAEELRAQGDAVGAADLLSAVGDQLWDRGFRLAAAYAYLSAVGADLTADRLERSRPRIDQVGGDGVKAHLELLIARVSQDLQGMRAGAQQAEDDGRWFFALLTWSEVAVLAERSGDLAAAEEAETHATRLRTEVEGTGVPAPLRRVPHNLTDREREIARLAASGLPNSEIGQMLFVSTRTVESHLNRAMRKAGVQTRQELRELYRSGR